MTCRSDYYHQRYLEKRDEILAQRREYYHQYEKLALRKPRKPRQSRTKRDHERYMEHREEILAKQKIYRETHREEIKQRRRERVLREIRNYYERREQQYTSGREDGGSNQVGHATTVPTGPARGLS